MKRVFQLAIAIFAFALTACSTCYECTYEVEVQSPSGAITTDTQSEEVCTSDAAEIDAREAEGQSCAAKSS